MSGHDTRRPFLQASAVGLAGVGMGYGVAGRASVRVRRSADGEPVVACLGTGIRYHEDLGHVTPKFGPTAAICDVDSVQAGRALQVAFDEHRAAGRPLQTDIYEDYRHVLDRQDIDAVFIGTPDHWHTKI